MHAVPCSAILENVQRTLILPGNNVSSDQCVVEYKILISNGLGKQSGFSTVPVAQYCSVARERVK